MKIIRVFPRRTNATPDDDLAIVGRTPGFFDEADEVHISVTFTWDIPQAEKLAREWERVAPVKVGGPAYKDVGGEFIPGRYVKKDIQSPVEDAQINAGFAKHGRTKATRLGSLKYMMDGTFSTIIF